MIHTPKETLFNRKDKPNHGHLKEDGWAWKGYFSFKGEDAESRAYELIYLRSCSWPPGKEASWCLDATPLHMLLSTCLGSQGGSSGPNRRPGPS